MYDTPRLLWKWLSIQVEKWWYCNRWLKKQWYLFVITVSRERRKCIMIWYMFAVIVGGRDTTKMRMDSRNEPVPQMWKTYISLEWRTLEVWLLWVENKMTENKATKQEWIPPKKWLHENVLIVKVGNNLNSLRMKPMVWQPINVLLVFISGMR